MTLVLRYAARSDRGLVRSNNEDSVYAGARLLALADGMGGHAAGEVASQLMIAALAHLDDDEPGDDLLGKLAAATREGNASIADQVEEEPDLDGMGTTACFPSCQVDEECRATQRCDIPAGAMVGDCVDR